MSGPNRWAGLLAGSVAALAVTRQACAAPAAQEPGGGETMRVHVSQRNGSDSGDGSADRPFATIRRALALHAMVPERRIEIRLDLGHYGKGGGETFPIELPARARLVGFGSRSCEIVGLPEQPVLRLPEEGEVAIESVVLRGGSAGVAAAQLSAASTAETALAVVLVDVAILECAKGVDLEAARGRLSVRAEGLRVAKAEGPGLVAGGAAELSLTLLRSRFRQCKEGVELRCDGAPEDGPWQALLVKECRFEDNSEAGLVRRGKDGRNRAPRPWEIESSTFVRSSLGLAFEIPGGDVPFLIRDCDFAENGIFGVSIVGSGAPLPGASRLERCRLRWNGVGGQLLTMGRPLEMIDCRFEDSIGIGCNFGNLVGERSVLRAQRCLFARNGAAGFFGLCEREDGIDVELVNCTAADNRRSGVERKNRKRGSGLYRLVRCLVTGNSPDLEKIEPAELEDCFVGGDPRFVDREERDFRPASNSPALAGGVVRGALQPAPPGPGGR
jgi:hypothetical protein